ncbi:MAG: Hpt domain-containing protein [Acidobacteriota bacterium]|nr:Hpt domain-containing protein [Acidobacteriota bacterium]
MTVDHELNELKREFLDEALEKVGEMQSVLEAGKCDSASLERLAYLAHQLKGSGGSYGYQRISDHATDLEKTVESLADGDALDKNIRSHVTNLRGEIEGGLKELR